MIKNKAKNRKGQEEIVGFAVIVIIVAIILVILLGLSLSRKNPDKTRFTTTYEAESFTQAVLQYTSECLSGQEYLPIQDLIISCNSNELCNDGKSACDVLGGSIKSIIEASWLNVGENSSIKGYALKINTEENGILELKEGNQTSNSRGSVESFARSGTEYEMTFRLYS